MVDISLRMGCDRYLQDWGETAHPLHLSHANIKIWAPSTNESLGEWPTASPLLYFCLFLNNLFPNSWWALGVPNMTDYWIVAPNLKDLSSIWHWKCCIVFMLRQREEHRRGWQGWRMFSVYFLFIYSRFRITQTCISATLSKTTTTICVIYVSFYSSPLDYKNIYHVMIFLIRAE